MEHIKLARTEASEHGVMLNVVQIFAMGPRDRRFHLSAPEQAELRAYTLANDMHVIFHNPYVAPAWKPVPVYAEAIRAQLKVISAVNPRDSRGGLVVHLDKTDAPRVAARLPDLYMSPEDEVSMTPTIYLETPAVRSLYAHYSRASGIAELFRHIREGPDPKLERTGLCIDTAHLHSSGIALRTRDEADAWIAELEDIRDLLPPTNVIIHLNDNKKPLGMVPDAHAHLGQGEMWSFARGDLVRSGVGAFVNYGVVHDVPLILERGPGMSLTDDYDTLYPLLPVSWQNT